jgi:mRNA interferase MazF
MSDRSLINEAGRRGLDTFTTSFRRSSQTRPALVLAILPGPYQNVLICGISTQLQSLQHDWDELLNTIDTDFSTSGIHRASAIRLSYLYATESSEISGVIGRINSERLSRLRKRLANLLAQ